LDVVTSSRAVSRERGDLRLIINVLQGDVDELWRFRDSLYQLFNFLIFHRHCFDFKI
jgi:hypothetical protein